MLGQSAAVPGLSSRPTSPTYNFLPLGAIHTLSLSGINAHPFHLHVNSFQLAADPADTNGDYFKQGDWHDPNPSIEP